VDFSFLSLHNIEAPELQYEVTYSQKKMETSTKQIFFSLAKVYNLQ